MKFVLFLAFTLVGALIPLVYAESNVVKKWPVPITKADGWDTDEVACKTPQAWIARERLRAAGKDTSSFFAGGVCYTLMSEWGVTWENPKDYEHDAAKLTIETPAHRVFIGYGQPKFGDD